MPMWNAITVARACCAGLAGLALVILSASLVEATFGPRTTIGKNYQQFSDTQSEDRINPGPCDAINCTVLFQRMPQQRPLIVQHVACWASVNAGGLEVVWLGTRKGQTFPFRRTPLVPVNTTGNFWAVNAPVMHLIKSGERPYVRFFNSVASGLWFVRCSISGKLR